MAHVHQMCCQKIPQLLFCSALDNNAASEHRTERAVYSAEKNLILIQCREESKLIGETLRS